MISFGRMTISVFLSLVMMLCMAVGMMPLTAYADGFYEFSANTQSGNNNSTLSCDLTDENAGDIEIRDDRPGHVALYLSLDEGWYFEKWETYFQGYEDVALLTDPEVQGANPKGENGRYTFFNISQDQPFTNAEGKSPSGQVFLYVCKSTGFYGRHTVTAVLKPIVTVNAGEGVEYTLITNNPSYVNLAENQTAVKYQDDVTITYTIDDRYMLTGVNASGTKDIHIDETNSEVVLTGTEKPTSVGIHARLKQQNVCFDANGGSGTMAAQSFDSGVAEALAAGTFTKTDYVFAGWNTEADGSGTAYSDRQEVTFSPANDGDTLTLYAQWKEPVSAQDHMVTLSQTEFTYNGGEQKPTVSVEYNGVALTEGTDYTVTWPADVTSAGAKGVVIDFVGLYSGRVTKSYKINPADLGDAVVSISQDSFVYNGQAQKPTVTIEYKGVTLTEGVDYTAFFQAGVKTIVDGVPTKWFDPYYDCIHPETVYAMGRGMGNYTGFSPFQTFEIEKAPLTVTANDTTVTYGDALAGSGAVYDGLVSVESPDDLDGTLDYDYGCPVDADVGSYDITPKGLSSGDYEITFAKGTLTIVPREIGIQWSNTELFHIPGKAQAPTAAATGTVFGDALSLTVSGAQEAVGTYTATVTAMDGEKAVNYKLPADVTAVFSIHSVPTTPTPAPTDTPVEGSDVPPTGDDAPLARWLAVLGGCGLALAAPGIRRRKKADR